MRFNSYYLGKSFREANSVCPAKQGLLQEVWCTCRATIKANKVGRFIMWITKIYLMESFNISLLLSFLSAGWLGSNFLRSAKAPLTFCCLNLSLKLQFWQVIHQNMPIMSLCTCDLRIFFSCIWMVEAWPRLRSSEPGTPDLGTLSSRDIEDIPESQAQSKQRLGSRSHCMICSLQHWPRPRGLQIGHWETGSWS